MRFLYQKPHSRRRFARHFRRTNRRCGAQGHRHESGNSRLVSRSGWLREHLNPGAMRRNCRPQIPLDHEKTTAKSDSAEENIEGNQPHSNRSDRLSRPSQSSRLRVIRCTQPGLCIELYCIPIITVFPSLWDSHHYGIPIITGTLCGGRRCPATT